MAVLRFPETNQTIETEAEIRAALAGVGIDYERWSLDRVPPDSTADLVLDLFRTEINEMKRRGGYVTADVIDVNPETPGLGAMLARFDKEHTHSEDEVRFVLAGRGIFFLALDGGVAAVEVHPGDMLRIPRGTRHWFTLCVKIAASAPFAGSNRPRAGRRTIPAPASTRGMSHSASAPRILAQRSLPGFRRTRFHH